MPRRMKKRSNRPLRRRRPTRKPRVSHSDVARIHEVVEFEDVTANTVQGLNFSLFQFPRASELAPNFKWYRAAKVEWLIDPNYNIYAEGAVGGIANGSTTVPYLYHRMNRNQDGFIYTIRNLQAMGAKPIKFTKQLKYSYKPNWCSPGISSYATDSGPGTALVALQQQGLKCEYGWLMSPDSTPVDHTGGSNNKANSVVQGWTANWAPPHTTGMSSIATNYALYNGSDIFIDQYDSQIGTILARVTCKVTWEFKDPNFAQDQADLRENGSAPVAAEAVKASVETA